MTNRAGIYWFHPPPHARFGEQVQRSAAGLILVEDDEDEAVGLPPGEFDLALLVQDRRVSGANQLLCLQSMTERMTSFRGDRLLIYGRVDFTQGVSTAAYRVRLFNSSNECHRSSTGPFVR